MTTSTIPGRRRGRLAALTAALAIGGVALTGAGAAQAEPCPPDVCDPPIVVDFKPKPKGPWPGPVCLSCPREIELIDELVLPVRELGEELQVRQLGEGLRVLPEHRALEGIGG